jgi:hypothetical protein
MLFTQGAKLEPRFCSGDYRPFLATPKLRFPCSFVINPLSGETVILWVHQAVHIPTMSNNLLCPMQMRLNDVIVDDCPKFLHHNPTDTTHTLTVKDGSDTLVIPFSILGVTSYFPTRTPTVAENDTCHSFDLTFSNPDWNPSTNAFEQQEESQTDSYGRIQDPGDRPWNYFISDLSSELNGPRIPAPYFTSQCSAILMEIEPSLDDQMFYQMLKANVQIQSTTTTRRRGVMTAERLAKNWCISLEAAKQTLEVTTQRGIRTFAITHCYPVASEPTIDSYAIEDFELMCSQTQWSWTSCLSKAISMLRSLPHNLGGHEFTPWQRNPTLMMDY